MSATTAAPILSRLPAATLRVAVDDRTDVTEIASLLAGLMIRAVGISVTMAAIAIAGVLVLF